MGTNDHKTCSHCGVRKQNNEFLSTAGRKLRYVGACVSCRVVSHNRYMRNRSELITSSVANQHKRAKERLLYMKKYMGRLRLEVSAALGGKCARCGYIDQRALQIDHVNGDGWSELRIGQDKYSYYKKVLSDTKGRYQLLCANCNWIKRSENQEWRGGQNSRQNNHNPKSNLISGGL